MGCEAPQVCWWHNKALSSVHHKPHPPRVLSHWPHHSPCCDGWWCTNTSPHQQQQQTNKQGGWVVDETHGQQTCGCIVQAAHHNMVCLLQAWCVVVGVVQTTHTPHTMGAGTAHKASKAQQTMGMTQPHVVQHSALAQAAHHTHQNNGQPPPTTLPHHKHPVLCHFMLCVCAVDTTQANGHNNNRSCPSPTMPHHHHQHLQQQSGNKLWWR